MTSLDKRNFTRLLLATGAAAVLPGLALAQASKNRMAELAAYAGADRLQRLTEGAAKEDG